MATITGITAARALAIEASSVVGGTVSGGNLILTKRDGSTINAGPVVGPTGPTGSAGPTGNAGATGTNGTNGNTILSGSGAPNNSLGVNGDFYINLTATPAIQLHGPKASGAWPAGISLGSTGGGSSALDTAFPVTLGVALSDETSTITASTTVARATLRSPFAFTLSEVRITSNTTGTGTTTIVNVKRGGTDIFTTKPSIAIGQKSSVSGSTPQVISTTNISSDDELTFFIDQIATGMTGIKVWLIGTRTITTAATVPGAPTGVTGSVGATTVNLSWTTGSAGSTPTTSYNIQISTDGTNWAPTTPASVTAPTTSLTISGLTTGSSYQFRVQGVNASGGGPYGNSGTITPSTAPSEPTSVSANVTSSTTATITWNLPNINGGTPITAYIVERSINSGGTWSTSAGTIDVNARNQLATGLASGTPVIFRVRATNAGGFTGANSLSSASVTPSNATAPSAPTVGTAVATGATTATLTFTAPSSAGTDAGGATSTIASYVVERSTNSGTTWTPTSNTVSGTTASITGLSASTTYLFRISATNVSGVTGSPSAASNGVTTSGGGGAQTLTASFFKYARCTSTTYATAASGSGTFSVLPTVGTSVNVSNSLEGANYFVDQTFLEFNTAVGGSTVSAESFKITVVQASQVVTGMTLELYGYDFGTSVELADWRDSSALSGFTLLASTSITSSSSGVLTFTLSGTTLRDYIQARLSTVSRFVLAANTQRTNTTPTAASRVNLNASTAELAFTVA